MSAEDIDAGIADLLSRLEANEAERDRISESLAASDDRADDLERHAEQLDEGLERELLLAGVLQARHNRLVTEGQIAASRNLDELTAAVAAIARQVADISDRLDALEAR
jgi:prefoldin subunit 5